jgi:hypothetical protein
MSRSITARSNAPGDPVERVRGIGALARDRARVRDAGTVASVPERSVAGRSAEDAVPDVLQVRERVAREPIGPDERAQAGEDRLLVCVAGRRGRAAAVVVQRKDVLGARGRRREKLDLSEVVRRSLGKMITIV